MEYFIKSSVLIAIIYLIYIIWLRRDTLFQEHRWFLIIGLIIAVTLPLFEVIQYKEYSTSVSTISYETIQDMQIHETQTPPEINWDQLLKRTYLLGVVILSIRLLLQLISFFRLTTTGTRQTLNGIQYIKLKSNLAPFSFFNYIFYNPEIFTEAELAVIISHEHAHIKQVHTLDVILIEIACAIFWFNPFIWLYKRAIRENLEFVADQIAQKSVKDRLFYQRTLFKSALSKSKIALVNSFNSSMIKNRIVMLQKSKSHKMKILKYLVLLPVIAIFLMSFNTKTVYVEKQIQPTIENDTIEYWNVQKFVITPKTTDAKLQEIKSRLKKEQVIIDFSDVERNELGNLKGLVINYSTKSTNGNYVVNTTDSFKPISIEYDVTGDKLTIGTNESNGLSQVIKLEPQRVRIPMAKDTIYTRTEEKVIKKEKLIKDTIRVKSNNENSFTKIILREENQTFVADSVLMDEVRTNQWVSSDGTKTKIVAGNDKVYISTNDQMNDPLVILNGKITNVNVNEINAADIESINILKGQSAINIYGDAAENGAIQITTKSDAGSTPTHGSSLDENTRNVYISKNTTTNDLNESKGSGTSHIQNTSDDNSISRSKKMLEKALDVVTNISVKRNDKGIITKLKIEISDKNGNEANALFKDKNGIPDVVYGKKNDQLFIKSGTK